MTTPGLTRAKPPIRAILLDIGGVLVRSPMLGIRSYEHVHNLPAGFINHAISTSGPNGAWQRLERGEIRMDSRFFEGFRDDLRRVGTWRSYLWRLRERDGEGNGDGGSGSGSGGWDEEVVPEIDTEELFMGMMSISRTPDFEMVRAVRRLRKAGKYLIAALSNTTIFPSTHPFHAAHPFGEGGRRVRSDGTANPEFEPDGGTTAIDERGREGGSDKSEIKDLIDIFISSAHVGMRKPESRIYSLALRWLNDHFANEGQSPLEAEEVLFLDDIGANLKPARALGMRTIKVGLGEGAVERAVREMESILGLGGLLGGDGERERQRGKAARL